MAEKLKIYACSGIGEEKSDYVYWTDNTSAISNTQAVNTLLVRINSLYTRINYVNGVSDTERINALNNIDWLCVALDAAKRFKDDEQMLYHAGEVISVMLQDGAFEFNSLNNEERDRHLDELLDRAAEMYGDETIKTEDLGFMEDWKDQIISRNKVGLTKQQQQASIKALAKAVKKIGEIDDSWKENDEIEKYLTEAGTYFLYLYLTDKQLAKLPGEFKLKQKYQKQIYNHCKQYFVDVYGTEEDMQDIIRNGIRLQFNAEPETVCEGITSGEMPKGIGVFQFLGLVGVEAVKALIELLSVIASVLIAIVTSICTAVSNTNIAKYGVIKQQTIDDAVPNADDYKGLSFTDKSEKSNSNWLTIGLVGLGALLLLKK